MEGVKPVKATFQAWIKNIANIVVSFFQNRHMITFALCA